jgi:hypothetical protein
MGLNKMVRGVKSLSKTEKTSIYHYGLIRMLVIHEIRKQRFSWKTLITQHFSTKNEPIEEARPAPDEYEEANKKKGKKYKVAPSSSKETSQKDKARMRKDRKTHDSSSKEVGPSSSVNKALKSQELKDKSKLVEEISAVSLDEKGHKSNPLRKEKSSSKHNGEQPIEQPPVTIPQTLKRKRKLFSTSEKNNPSPPSKRTTRSMIKKGKAAVNPLSHEYPTDFTSSPLDLPVQDNIPSLVEDQVTITLCGMREEVEEREHIQLEITDSMKTLTKEQMRKKIEELQKQNQELKQEVKQYQLLDRYIKKENKQLKETSQQLQYDHEETYNNLKKVPRLLQYTRVIKRELKEEALTVNIIDPQD